MLLALRKERWDDQKLKAILNYVVSSRIVWTIGDPLSKND